MRTFFLATCVCLLLTQCKVNKNRIVKNDIVDHELDELTISAAGQSPFPYRPSVPHRNDLVHTSLYLRFDYTKQHVHGKAILTLKPHFYAVDSVSIDAKNFSLDNIALLSETDTANLSYSYDGRVIRIALGKHYTARDTYQVLINYTAKPNEITDEGSASIRDAEGLYFINPARTDKSKPRQIWTQGETQSSSAWFPTLDAPNQKMTQDIFLTVDKSDITLSNGELIFSKENEDGTRTDHWKQSQPHAPYLAMAAVGEFAVVKDFWRDSLEVNYYVEPAYKPYARLVFGHTPEMMECFSKRLGVDYPWSKFSQIVVRDFVSGAMENTTAVVHFDGLQHDAREHLDDPHEDIIAHELFHQWFGDLVTCESWSNIPLNESFATYGEYIWDEYKYGRMHADYYLDENLRNYLGNRSNIWKTPIRFHYEQQEEVFDDVSYEKGGCMLHMLRHYVGDSAFFSTLKYYLTKHRFGTVEIHDLRMAFEKITGEDLNWFFNQWFMKPGHPTLQFDYQYDAQNKKVTVTVSQLQDSTLFGIYTLPIQVDVYSNGHVRRVPITISERKQVFEFEEPHPIDLVNIDAEKVLVADIDDNQPPAALRFQFEHAPLYADKQSALSNTLRDTAQKNDSVFIPMLEFSLQHPFFGIRRLGLLILQTNSSPGMFNRYESTLQQIAAHDSSSLLRGAALYTLWKTDQKKYLPLIESRLNDSSYLVVSAALLFLYQIDDQKGMKAALQFENTTNNRLMMALSQIYERAGDSSKIGFFMHAFEHTGKSRRIILDNYWDFLALQSPGILLQGLNSLASFEDSFEASERQLNSRKASRMAGNLKKKKKELDLLLEKEKDNAVQARLLRETELINSVLKALDAFKPEKEQEDQ